MENNYFEKVYLDNGELPDKEGCYKFKPKNSNIVIDQYFPNSLSIEYYQEEYEYWERPDSIKHETISFVEWMDKNVLQMHSIHSKPWCYNSETFTTEELYDKYKMLK